MISMDKRYRTRDGREVRIYAVDGANLAPIHGAILDENEWDHHSWKGNGGYLGANYPCNADLIEVTPPKPKLCAWKVNGEIRWLIDNEEDVWPEYKLKERKPEYDIEAKT